MLCLVQDLGSKMLKGASDKENFVKPLGFFSEFAVKYVYGLMVLGKNCLSAQFGIDVGQQQILFMKKSKNDK